MPVVLQSLRDNGALRTVEAMGLQELEAVRTILRGGSVIDWKRLNFRDEGEVDHFLKLNLLDVEDPQDERRLRGMLAQSVEYLRTTFGYRVADPVAQPKDIREVFLVASGKLRPKYRRIACIVAKCMHVVHHLEARELLFRTAVREADLSRVVDLRVMAEAKRMRDLGFPIVEFSGNVKARGSLITKLLAKRESVAAQIFDRVRYRIITERPDQIMSVLEHLTRTLFPFNYTVPGQTHNSLVQFRDQIAGHPNRDQLVRDLQIPLEAEDFGAPKNEFTGESYRALNFVVDLPVRIDDFMRPGDEPVLEELGRVVFSLVEFQLVDQTSARANEAGDSSHDAYKRRQLGKVLRRLSRGLVVPKKRAAPKAPQKG